MTTSAHPIQPAAVRLAIDGMRCASCVANVEKVLRAVPGVPNAIAISRATVRNIKQNLFGDLGISADLPPGKPHDVALPSLQPGVYEFTCQMGMYRGKIVAK